MSQPELPDLGDLAVSAAHVARALQDTMAVLAPSYGVKAETWDALGASMSGLWTRNLVVSVVAEVMRQGYIVLAGRDAFAHLAADWDAQAAQIERESAPVSTSEAADEYQAGAADTFRDCARRLRDLTGTHGGPAA